ncbi:MAG: GntR family transcriptional regulator [Treponema sp.]|jgi:GntR family transcriptional repressor for pyruvate dehydrogenase complex|nr:GntR family transcriptional regulator [Treponema sp.]
MVDNIRSGLWQIGYKIPSENELAQTYGVNRLTVRLALQKLSTMGLIETKVGEGSFVKKFRFSHYIDQAADFYINDEMLASVHDFRGLLEIECARLAIIHSTKEEKEELYRLLQIWWTFLQQRKPYNQGEKFVDDLMEADLNFHSQICVMSHNILYARTFVMARAAIKEHIRMLFKKRRVPLSKKKDSFEYHQDTHVIIYESIIAKDFELCKKAYIEMLDSKII